MELLFHVDKARPYFLIQKSLLILVLQCFLLLIFKQTMLLISVSFVHLIKIVLYVCLPYTAFYYEVKSFLYFRKIRFIHIF